MRKSSIKKFIRKMDRLGDHWEPEDVKRVYGKTTLRKAIRTRKKEIKEYQRGFDALRKAGYDVSSINDPRINKRSKKKK